MGCNASSTAKTKPKSKHHHSSKSKQDNESARRNKTYRLKEDVTSILQNVKKIPKTENTFTIVTFGKLATPVVNAPLYIEEGEFSNISFPVIALNYYGSGRLVALGNSSMILSSDSDNSIFVQNVIQWASGESSPHILLLDFSEALYQSTESFFKNLGFEVFSKTTIDTINEEGCSLIITNTSTIYGNTILDFLNKGGGCIVIPSDTSFDQFFFNQQLSFTGLSYSSCPLIIGPLNAKYFFPNLEFDKLRKSHFISYSDEYLYFLSNHDADMDPEDLDSAVTPLIYNIGEMSRASYLSFKILDQLNNNILESLTEATVKYLTKTGAFTETQVCPTLIHGILSTLICNLFSRLSAESLISYDFSTPFPGYISSKTNCFTQTICFDKLKVGWNSTGLYLIPKIISIVQIELAKDDDVDDIIIQIGSYNTMLTSKEGPWNRWSYLIEQFECSRDKFQIASPFGGPIYLECEKSHPPIIVTFSHVCYYPFYNQQINYINDTNLNKSNKDKWNGTLDSPGLIAEIQFKHLIFTLHKDRLKEIENIEESEAFFNELTDKIYFLLGKKEESKTRIIFDVDLPTDDPIAGYPIVFLDIFIPSVFNKKNVSNELFLLLVYITTSLIPPDYFNEEHQQIIVTLITSAAFKTVFKKSPFDYIPYSVPSEFNEIWDLYSKGQDELLSSAMEKVFSLPENNDNEDKWNVFLSILKYDSNQNSPSFQSISSVPNSRLQESEMEDL